MMINKRLIAAVPDCKSHIAAKMTFQWLPLIANIAMMAAIAHFLGSLAIGSLNNATIGISLWFCSCTGPFPSPSPASLPSTFSFSERSWHNKNRTEFSAVYFLLFGHAEGHQQGNQRNCDQNR